MGSRAGDRPKRDQGLLMREVHTVAPGPGGGGGRMTPRDLVHFGRLHHLGSSDG